MMTSDAVRSVEPRTYRRSESATFQKTTEQFGGLSNMAPGFPLEVNGVSIGTSEVLYQCCRFPHLPDVQRQLVLERSPMTAKMKSKPYRAYSRADFELIKVTVMRWCLRVKLLQNWKAFSSLLESTGNRPIVEVSTKDAFWGARPQGNEILVGGNVMGRLLMELREHVRGPQRDALQQEVAPPDVAFLLLLGQAIGVAHAQRKTSRGALQALPPLSTSAPVVHVRFGADNLPSHDQNAVSLSSLVLAFARFVSLEHDVEDIDLVLRCRPGREERVRMALHQALADARDDQGTRAAENETQDALEEQSLPLFQRSERKT